MPAAVPNGGVAPALAAEPLLPEPADVGAGALAPPMLATGAPKVAMGAVLGDELGSSSDPQAAQSTAIERARFFIGAERCAHQPIGRADRLF